MMFAKRNAERAAKEQKRKIEEELSLLHMLSEEHDEDNVFLNKTEMREVYKCNDPNTLKLQRSCSTMQLRCTRNYQSC